MADIARVANEKRCSSDRDMTVLNLAEWHSDRVHHASWVLGIRHDKEGGASRNRQLSIHDGCTNIFQNNGVCIRHGAKRKLRTHDGCTNLGSQKQ